MKKLRDYEHRWQALSRRPRGGKDWVQGDLTTGASLAEAVEGVAVRFVCFY